jgi:hypothetical protein
MITKATACSPTHAHETCPLHAHRAWRATEGLSTEERDELTRLKREVKRLTMERDLLKRSVAFWVKELDR